MLDMLLIINDSFYDSNDVFSYKINNDVLVIILLVIVINLWMF